MSLWLLNIGRDKKQTNKKPPHNKKTSNSIAHDMSEQSMIFILIKSLPYLTMFDVCWFRHDPHIQVSIINQPKVVVKRLHTYCANVWFTSFIRCFLTFLKWTLFFEIFKLYLYNLRACLNYIRLFVTVFGHPHWFCQNPIVII